MERSLRWRTIGLVAVIAICVGTLVPSFASGLPSWFPFKSQIVLGLDLQGGLHAVYSIDLDKAVDDKASEIKRDLDARFNEGEWKGKVTVSTPATPVGALTVKVADPARLEEVKKLIKSDYVDTLVDRSCSGDAAGAYCARVSSDYAEGIKRSALRNTVKKVRERIDESGVAEPSVVEKGDQIIVELPGLDSERIGRIKDIIARSAKLEFKMVEESSPYMLQVFRRVEGEQGGQPDPEAKRLDITADNEQRRANETGKNYDDYWLIAYDREESVTVEEAKSMAGCNVKKLKVEDGKVRCKRSGRDVIHRYLEAVAAADPKLKVPEDRQVAYELVEPPSTAKDQRPYWRTWYLDRAVRLSGSAVTQAVASWDPSTGKPLVYVDFNRTGGRIFGDLTSQNVGRRMAIILDDKVTSAPTIESAILGGRASITMGSSDTIRAGREAEDLVAVLKTGSLSAPLLEESAAEIGPTLGRDAVDKAQVAFGLGMILVIGLLFYIYRISGLIALVTLALNVLFVLTVLAWFDAALTLPGIAGIVLTFGMSVDGNIIIFERIREELQTGKSIRGAVDTGFGRAFGAILDGQLTTMAGGFVLLYYGGSGPIVGFAVTLIIGNVTALFANIWCTRVIFEHYLNYLRAREAPLSI